MQRTAYWSPDTGRSGTQANQPRERVFHASAHHHPADIPSRIVRLVWAQFPVQKVAVVCAAPWAEPFARSRHDQRSTGSQRRRRQQAQLTPPALAIWVRPTTADVLEGG